MIYDRLIFSSSFAGSRKGSILTTTMGVEAAHGLVLRNLIKRCGRMSSKWWPIRYTSGDVVSAARTASSNVCASTKFTSSSPRPSPRFEIASGLSAIRATGLAEPVRRFPLRFYANTLRSSCAIARAES